MKKKKLVLLLFFIAFLLSVFSLFYDVFLIIKWKDDNEKIQIETNTIYEITTINESTGGNSVNSVNKKQNDLYWDYIKMNMIDVDLNELIKKNKDTKGWIRVNGTNINYPFVQAKDNEYYLKRSFEKKKTGAGWIFLDYRNDIDNLGSNNIIYGHARLDKSMFGTLKYTNTKKWLNDKSNHLVYISTLKENTMWLVFSIYNVKTENYYITTDFKEDEFDIFLNTIKNRSLYDFGTTVVKSDKILTLSTCYKNNQKFVLHAKLIKKEEK